MFSCTCFFNNYLLDIFVLILVPSAKRNVLFGRLAAYDGASSPLIRHYRGYPWRPFRLSIFCCRKIHGPAGALMCACEREEDTTKNRRRELAFRQRGTSSPHRSLYYYYLIYYLGNYVSPPPSIFQERSKELAGYVVNNGSSCTKSCKSTNFLP